MNDPVGACADHPNGCPAGAHVVSESELMGMLAWFEGEERPSADRITRSHMARALRELQSRRDADQMRCGHETEVRQTHCPYCQRPASADGVINHAAPCAGLETIELNRLQYDTLRRNGAPPECVYTQDGDGPFFDTGCGNRWHRTPGLELYPHCAWCGGKVEERSEPEKVARRGPEVTESGALVLTASDVIEGRRAHEKEPPR